MDEGPGTDTSTAPAQWERAPALVTLSDYGRTQVVSRKHSSIFRLAQPWPPGLRQASPTAMRAVHAAGQNTTHITLLLSSAEMHSLLALPGSRASVEAFDASDFYEARAHKDGNAMQMRRRLAGRSSPGPPLDVALQGSMGGYFTCVCAPTLARRPAGHTFLSVAAFALRACGVRMVEIAREMSRLVATYPEWLAPAERVGTTRQGRPIELWCLAAGGASGCAARSDRPAVLFTSLVHSREPATLMCLVHALRTLLMDATEHVGGVRQLLAARRLLWMPVANPDGYAWNERTRVYPPQIRRRACSCPACAHRIALRRHAEQSDADRMCSIRW